MGSGLFRLIALETIGKREASVALAARIKEPISSSLQSFARTLASSQIVSFSYSAIISGPDINRGSFRAYLGVVGHRSPNQRFVTPFKDHHTDERVALAGRLRDKLGQYERVDLSAPSLATVHPRTSLPMGLILCLTSTEWLDIDSSSLARESAHQFNFIRKRSSCQQGS